MIIKGVLMVEKKLPNYPINPRVLFLKILGAVFLAEFFVMFFMSLLPDLPLALGAFLDAFTLSILVVPFLYFFLFQPIQKTIIDRERTEAERSELKKMCSSPLQLMNCEPLLLPSWGIQNYFLTKI